MKKLLLSLFSLTLTCGLLMGQDATSSSESFKAEAGDFTVEASYSPMMHFFTEQTPTYGGASSGVGLMSFLNTSVRYYINSNMAVRLKMGIGALSDKNVESINSMVDGNFVKVGENTRFSQQSCVYFTPGFEYHFNNFKRVSPYVGAEIGLGGNINKTHVSNTINQEQEKTRTSTFGLTLAAISGVDVYICQGFYIGFEVGLGYAFNTQGKTKIYTVDSEGKVLTDEATRDSYQNTAFGGLSFAPAVRIGWTF